jgi:hypothetical protein
MIKRFSEGILRDVVLLSESVAEKQLFSEGGSKKWEKSRENLQVALRNSRDLTATIHPEERDEREE